MLRISSDQALGNTKSERHRWDLMSNSPCCYLKGMADYSLGESPVMSHLCMGVSLHAEVLSDRTE